MALMGDGNGATLERYVVNQTLGKFFARCCLVENIA